MLKLWKNPMRKLEKKQKLKENLNKERGKHIDKERHRPREREREKDRQVNLVKKAVTSNWVMVSVWELFRRQRKAT